MATPLFFVRCLGDGSWLTSREPKGSIFAINPPDPMLVSKDLWTDSVRVAEAAFRAYGPAYELVPTPFTSLGPMNIFATCDEDVNGRRIEIPARVTFDDAIIEAKAALVGDSNDAERDALHALVEVLGYDVPECECDAEWKGHGHATTCPAAAWEKPLPKRAPRGGPRK